MIDLFLFALIIYLFISLYLDYKQQKQHDFLLEDLKFKIENSKLDDTLEKLEKLLNEFENKGK
jgi:hypothetical protein|nr:MAG TPA: hypothetical protein [Caudoviricetes sp.]